MQRKSGSLAYLPALVVAIGIALAGIYADQAADRRFHADARLMVSDRLATVRARIEGIVNTNAVLVEGLVAAMSLEPDMTQARFAALARPLISERSQLRNIGAAPDLVIRLMYPLQGNERAIGLDYRSVPAQRAAAQRAVEARRLILAGPVDLVQGGRGLIARVPVFVEGLDAPWGLVSAVIDFDRFLAASGMLDPDLPVDIALRGKDAAGAGGEVFFGDARLFDADPVQADIALPYGSWRIAALPRGGWQGRPDAWLLRLAFLLGGILVVAPVAVIGRLHDDKRRAMALLGQSEEKFSAAFEHSPLALLIAEQGSGRLIEVNRAFTDVTGWPKDEAVGRTMDELGLFAPASAAAAFIGAREPVQGAEVVMQPRSGLALQCRLSCRDIAYGDRGCRLAQLEDVTARKTAEAERRAAELELRATAGRLTMVLETTAEGVFGLDDEARVMFANSAAAQLLGWPSPEAMHGRQSAEITGHLLADGCPCAPDSCRIRSTIDTGESHRVADEFFVSRLGAAIPVEYVVSPLVVSEVVVGAVVAFHDIGARKALEEELKRSNAELEQFAYVASHDLRQPLRMVSSYLTLIGKRLKGRLDDDEEKFLAFAVNGAKKMDALILGLLEYSRVGRTGQPGPVELDEVVAEALDHLAFAVTEAKAQVSVAAGLPRVTGDRMEMMRLFQNLIGNAVKYRAEDRAPVVTVGWRDGGAEWQLFVQDNGIGIAPEDRGRAFGIFQRLVPSDRFEGTGIGLAVCKKVVERAGGRIWIESEPGHGSTFWIALPKMAAAP
ncbi:MAG: ATP-binding protein [Actinomycetota bacterium]